MTLPTSRMRVVAVHKGRPRWGTMTPVAGEVASVLFDGDTEKVWVPRNIISLAGVTPYPDDGAADYYWRRDQEVHAEWLAHLAKDPKTRGEFTPVTYID